MFLRLAIIAAALGSTVPAYAFECARAYLAVDFAICSDPAVVAKVDRLQVTWDRLLPSLPEDVRASLKADQRQWIKDYAARCGLPGRGRPVAEALPLALPCIAAEMDQRQAYLERSARAVVASAESGNSGSAPQVGGATPSPSGSSGAGALNGAGAVQAQGAVAYMPIQAETKRTAVPLTQMPVTRANSGEVCKARGDMILNLAAKRDRGETREQLENELMESGDIHWACKSIGVLYFVSGSSGDDVAKFAFFSCLKEAG